MKSMSDNTGGVLSTVSSITDSVEKGVRLILFGGIALALGYAAYYLWSCRKKHGGKLNIITVTECLGGDALDSAGDLLNEAGKEAKKGVQQSCDYMKKKHKSGWNQFTATVIKITAPGSVIDSTCHPSLAHKEINKDSVLFKIATSKSKNLPLNKKPLEHKTK